MRVTIASGNLDWYFFFISSTYRMDIEENF
jgi:hypothetical protein